MLKKWDAATVCNMYCQVTRRGGFQGRGMFPQCVFIHHPADIYVPTGEGNLIHCRSSAEAYYIRPVGEASCTSCPSLHLLGRESNLILLNAIAFTASNVLGESMCMSEYVFSFLSFFFNFL